MTEWIDFGVYATFMVVWWFVAPTVSSRWTRAFLADRNPEWAAAHPEIGTRYNSRWYLWSCYVGGTLCIGALLAFQLGFWPQASSTVQQAPGWTVLWDIHSAGALVGLVWYLGSAIGFGILWARKVPLAERRQATLERRSLDDFIPRWFRLATYALLIINLAAWLVVGLLDLYSTPIFWRRAALLLGLSAFFSLFAQVPVIRPPNAADRIFGPGYRRGEAQYVFAMAFGPLIVGAVRLYEEVMNTIVFDINRAMQLGIALFIIFGVLRATRRPKSRDASGATRPPSPTPALSIQTPEA